MAAESKTEESELDYLKRRIKGTEEEINAIFTEIFKVIPVYIREDNDDDIETLRRLLNLISEHIIKLLDDFLYLDNKLSYLEIVSPFWVERKWSNPNATKDMDVKELIDGIFSLINQKTKTKREEVIAKIKTEFDSDSASGVKKFQPTTKNVKIDDFVLPEIANGVDVTKVKKINEELKKTDTTNFAIIMWAKKVDNEELQNLKKYIEKYDRNKFINVLEFIKLKYEKEKENGSFLVYFYDDLISYIKSNTSTSASNSASGPASTSTSVSKVTIEDLEKTLAEHQKNLADLNTLFESYKEENIGQINIVLNKIIATLNKLYSQIYTMDKSDFPDEAIYKYIFYIGKVKGKGEAETDQNKMKRAIIDAIEEHTKAAKEKIVTKFGLNIDIKTKPYDLNIPKGFDIPTGKFAELVKKFTQLDLKSKT